MFYCKLFLSIQELKVFYCKFFLSIQELKVFFIEAVSLYSRAKGVLL